MALAMPRAALADDEADGGTKRAWSHKGQFGVSVDFGTGYRSIFPYDEEWCGSTDAVCSARAPFFVDFTLTYGVTRAVELVADVRLGLEDDFQPAQLSQEAPTPISFGGGVRFYVDDTGSSKFFTSFLVGLDQTDYSGSGSSVRTDVLLRNVNGLLIDFHRTFGAYVFLGANLGFVRWLSFQVDAGVGLQARFP